MVKMMAAELPVLTLDYNRVGVAMQGVEWAGKAPMLTSAPAWNMRLANKAEPRVSES